MGCRTLAHCTRSRGGCDAGGMTTDKEHMTRNLQIQPRTPHDEPIGGERACALWRAEVYRRTFVEVARAAPCQISYGSLVSYKGRGGAEEPVSGLAQAAQQPRLRKPQSKDKTTTSA